MLQNAAQFGGLGMGGCDSRNPRKADSEVSLLQSLRAACVDLPGLEEHHLPQNPSEGRILAGGRGHKQGHTPMLRPPEVVGLGVWHGSVVLPLAQIVGWSGDQLSNHFQRQDSLL